MSAGQIFLRYLNNLHSDEYDRDRKIAQIIPCYDQLQKKMSLIEDIGEAIRFMMWWRYESMMSASMILPSIGQDVLLTRETFADALQQFSMTSETNDRSKNDILRNQINFVDALQYETAAFKLFDKINNLCGVEFVAITEKLLQTCNVHNSKSSDWMMSVYCKSSERRPFEYLDINADIQPLQAELYLNEHALTLSILNNIRVFLHIDDAIYSGAQKKQTIDKLVMMKHSTG
ncbi:MAG: hypothetical protein EOP45_16255, partial [Sphingobacteriaceae bacterium]